MVEINSISIVIPIKNSILKWKRTILAIFPGRYPEPGYEYEEPIWYSVCETGLL